MNKMRGPVFSLPALQNTNLRWAGLNWANSCCSYSFQLEHLFHLHTAASFQDITASQQKHTHTHSHTSKKRATIIWCMMNYYYVFLSTSRMLNLQSRGGPSCDHVGALHMLRWGSHQQNTFCRFGPSSQARSCLPAQTSESSGSIWGSDAESSWQASLWRVCD